jgi:DNA-binding transcriptional ArsR family regulator
MPTLDLVLAAISDPTRRAILDRLTRGPARVTDVAEPFEMSLAAVSKHVQMLERAGQVVRWTSRYERFWNERLDRLESFFAQKGRNK